MIKVTTVLFGLATLLCLNGCNSNTIDKNSSGPSNGQSQKFGSLSGSKDVAGHLESNAWTSIMIDLDKYLYDTKGSQKTYKMKMTFKDGKVSALADCYKITARYKIKDDEISFSRVSSPKPAIDEPRCTSFKNADSAVSNFFSSDYIVSVGASNSASFEATDLDSAVTLKR